MAEDAKVIYNTNTLCVRLPLTQPTGKIRVKERSFFGEYGNPVAVRQNTIQQNMYVEWQIGYDLLASGADRAKNASKTSLSTTFRNYKGEQKFAYELSEIIFYAFQNKLISLDDINNLKANINSVSDNNLLDVIDSMRITRTNPILCQMNGLDFYEMKVSYPLVVHKFGNYDIYAEVINREKQRAVGVQPMLYVCIPITSLTISPNPIGRVLNSKECGDWVIGTGEAQLALELFRIFGMLSAKHRFDVLAILNMLFPN
jgi:hypothetical protein